MMVNSPCAHAAHAAALPLISLLNFTALPLILMAHQCVYFPVCVLVGLGDYSDLFP